MWEDPIMPAPTPLALTDAQLDAIHRAAWPLQPQDRSAFLEAVAVALQQERTLGDGVVYRVAMQCQRRFWTPPDTNSKKGVPTRNFTRRSAIDA
jgi:hypothetical protein